MKDPLGKDPLNLEEGGDTAVVPGDGGTDSSLPPSLLDQGESVLARPFLDDGDGVGGADGGGDGAFRKDQMGHNRTVSQPSPSAVVCIAFAAEGSFHSRTCPLMPDPVSSSCPYPDYPVLGES